MLPNPVGYNRAYVHVDGDFTYEKWRDGLLAGRSFVSNGPLLRCRANNSLPGTVFKSATPLEITLEGRLDTLDPLQAIELVHNGRVKPITLPSTIRVEQSGWFLVRAITTLTNTFRYGSTAPWYVEIEGKPAVQKESAQFFVDWCRERIAILEKIPELHADQKREVLQPWASALQFWTTRQ